MIFPGVKFVGNPEDHTGYGRAGLYMIEAMLSAGIPVCLRSVNFLSQKMKLPSRIEYLKSNNIKYGTVFMELTPENFPAYKEHGKRNVGYFFWETDRIPQQWVSDCNKMDEIWVPCRSNMDACLVAGVNVPIRIVPQPCPRPNTRRKVWIPGADSETYIFYSIFQWTERKNPQCLLRAYWEAFHSGENVILVIKTYASGDSQKDIDTISRSIGNWRAEAQRSTGASSENMGKVYFLSKILSDEQMDNLQNTGNCFVTAARGEGWNIPAANALMMGQPVISPPYGGVVDMMKKDDYYSVPRGKMIPVSGMPWIKWYESNQRWCDPPVDGVANALRRVFDNNIRSVDYGGLINDISVEGVGKLVKRILSGVA